ncbi:tryptophan-rich sensory protein [Microbacterium dextranolyticum]|uniref:Tryptophan-rich sensory protein n=1 Tax=Microbacterium dextranolyticum TaxID=36806 RepID=A0A9W6HJ83_9MICO|nr:tryptophan-rich sensory protein [Microbacterium dextranolyticum]
MTDLARQIVVISAVVFMIIAAMFGVGLFGGTNVRDLQNGALAADATALAPATQAFSIWSVVYLLMIAYAIWQALPGERTRERQRTVGWWVALTAVLNGGWLLAAQYLNLLATVVAIVALLVALCITMRRLVLSPAERWMDRLLLDGTVGIHLGWVALATVANIAAWLGAEVVPAPGEAAQTAWAIGVLVVVGLIGVALVVGAGGRIAPALAMAWGLVWIGAARTSGEPHAPAVGATAFIVAAVILLSAALAMVRRRTVAGAIGD